MIFVAELIAEYRLKPTDDPWGRWITVDSSGPVPRVVVRDPDAMLVYELAPAAGKVNLRPTAVFRESGSRCSAAGTRPFPPDFSFAVLAGHRSYRAVAKDGSLLWERSFKGWDENAPRYAYCSLWPDGEVRVWLIVPSDDTRDPGEDRAVNVCLLALNADGAELARLLLPGGPPGSWLDLKWALRDVLVGVTLSQRFSTTTTFRLEIGCNGMELGEPLFIDREVLGFQPSGRALATVGTRTGDISWQRFPGGEIIGRLSREAILASVAAHDNVHDCPSIGEYWGGYVEDDTLLFSLYDEPDGLSPAELDDWVAFSHWLADLTSGRVIGRVTYPEGYPLSSGGDGHALGDGTWLTTHSDRVYRWRIGS